MSGTTANIEALDLIAGSIGVAALDQCGFSDRRFIAALNEMLAALGIGGGAVGGPQRRSASFADWKSECSNDLSCRYAIGTAGTIDVRLARVLFDAAFEHYYGGESCTPATSEASAAQLRFAARLGHRLGDMLAAAWPDMAGLSPSLINATFEPDEDDLPRDGVLIVDVRVTWQREQQTISLAMPLAVVAAVRRPASTALPLPGKSQNDSSARLVDRLGAVRLPVRSVLARPELPAAHLLALKPGDILPLTMPSGVPVSVGNRQLAHGTLGEHQGRAAIRIEALSERSE